MGNAFLVGQGGNGMSNKKIKEYLNSTVGTDNEMSLDLLIPYRVAIESETNIIEFSAPGNYVFTNIPIWATRVSITACAGGGSGGFNNTTSGYIAGTGGGGGGQAILNEIHNLSNIHSITIVVGKGGGSTTSPGNGTDTTISEFNISLAGGKYGDWLSGSAGSAGGAAGGSGGGKGGNGGRSSREEGGSSGSPGVVGAGGAGAAYDDGYGGGGGGGGSLGSGGKGRTTGTRTTAHDGVRGGGGGGASAKGLEAGHGGNGYVKLEFLP